MNDNQKERLLKIAETNPELAKEMMDFMKEEKQTSQEPIAVKMVKAEEDKIEITKEMLNKAKLAIVFFIISALCFLSIFAYFGFNIYAKTNATNFNFVYVGLLMGGTVLFGVIADLIIAKSIGFPMFKKILPRHFSLSKNY